MPMDGQRATQLNRIRHLPSSVRERRVSRASQKGEPLLLQLKNLLHQAPLFVAGERGVGALGLGDKGFPFGLAGQVGKAGHVALEVKVVHGVHDHEHVSAATEDLHVQDSHLFLALHHFGPYMLVDVAVAADHVRIVQQFKGLAISFHLTSV